ncbi:glucans biosynthesis glucosyltransferase MdoH [Leptospira idonii]|uniref:Glucans biosynthesis glucosyltransferase H n=1 Tax=Leptospira idonii TaxID=1193500 RepID=A0A4R9M0K5_9LEPT|nr:glucans biosynthesis glucosyltransferase MdoH [Leptospira idonii]TGN20254.1 glucans biosynthesis glucosyltransferase MdoH [Leptospira idonii]
MIKFRRIVFLTALLIPILWGLTVFFRITSFRGIEMAEYYQGISLCVLFPLLSYGAMISIFGFIQRRKKKGDNLRITSLLQEDWKEKALKSPLAIVMPIYGEDVKSTISRIKVIYQSLKDQNLISNTDIFILSDTRDPDLWVKEELAYHDLCEELHCFDKIFYRRRKINLNGKSGNLADFCRRWGKIYRYMLVLDADSMMTAECIGKMTAIMESDANIGILQTSPKLFGAKTLFQKMNQFSSSLLGGSFLAGAGYWQLDAGSYWGHNAIIRIKPFMEHCALPHLPEYGAIGGKILSHDTVESALMRRAGYSVFVAYDLEGSYEESPPNLLDSLKRDNRWCQGNLQHIWFLFVKNIPFLNRLHILLGILSYLSAPIWGMYIFLSLWNYWEDFRFLNFSLLPKEFEFFTNQIYLPLYYELLGLSLTLLFLPRILGYIDAMLTRNLRKAHGGSIGLTLSFLLETITSIFLAPVYLIYYTTFIFYTLANRKIEWAPQNRDSNKSYSFQSILQSFFGITLLGIVVAYVLNDFSEVLFYSSLPIWSGWILSIPIVYITSLTIPSRRILNFFFKTQEETEPNKELSQLLRLLNTETNTPKDYLLSGIFLALAHPRYFRIHKGMQGKKKAHPSFSLETKKAIDDLVHLGPNELSRKSLSSILTNADALEEVHFKIWSSRPETLGSFWRENWAYLNN